YPETFKVAVAGGPVTDWKYYEVMYGERYMDTPESNPEGYEASSLVNQTSKLEGKLLIIHGDMDPVVVWQQSLSFLKKCIIEGKQLDYFVYPGYEHNVRGKDRAHLIKKISLYFDENL
ncbi:MAG: prolyl oligopeptidase family serine peptidase, partial [Ignavibacteria bacterium]|nr:prolyl oligopeptidase family serine peptidase [Ignavibacteria bacterium]